MMVLIAKMIGARDHKILIAIQMETQVQIFTLVLEERLNGTMNLGQSQLMIFKKYTKQ